MHTHTLTEGHPILFLGDIDPIRRRKFSVGDTVVACRHCRNIFLLDTWGQVCRRSDEHGGCDNTLADLAELLEIRRPDRTSPIPRPPAPVPPPSPPSPSPH